MKEILQNINLIKWIIQDEFKHEFQPLMLEIKRKMKLNVNKITLFFILIIYQYTFIFLLLLILHNFQKSVIFLISFGLISLFNLILPATIARTGALRIVENPIFECLIMSKLNESDCKKIMIVAELINFWLHNFVYEMITIGLLIIKFKIMGCVYSLVWLILVSLVFVKVLMKKNHISRLNLLYNYNALYLFNLTLSGLTSFLIYRIFIRALKPLSLKNFFTPTVIKNYMNVYIENIMMKIKEVVPFIIGVSLFLSVVYILLMFRVKNIHKSKKNTLVAKYVLKLFSLVSYFSNAFWVKRDLKWTLNISSRLEINTLLIFFSPANVFFIIYYICSMFYDRNVYVILISLDFVFWISIYQFANFLVQKIPVLNISSELRNIELIKMSRYTLDNLIKSKQWLLAIFLFPINFLVVICKIILVFIGCNPVLVVCSLILNLMIFIFCIILVLKWTLILPKFDWENIFMLKQDNFDYQILQQFLIIPSRLLTLYFSVSFVFTNVVKVTYKFSFLLLYYLLSMIVVTIILILLKRRAKNEIFI